MKRNLYQQLKEWKTNKRRKPLLLQGARQVGKTWLIKEFGKNEYDSLLYFNFEQDPDLKSIFSHQLNPATLIEHLEIYSGKKIIAGKSLVFFDEIQVAPQALTSLKYFYEQAPEYHIIAAGSLLGVNLNKNVSFPVGKVNFLELFPMSFDEFLLAAGEDLLVSHLQNSYKALPETIHQKINEYLKKYLFLGGMPEVLQSYFQRKDYTEVRAIQHEILEAYQRDFSKYAEKKQAVKTALFWQSVPYQLAKENKKFKYSEIKKHTRAAYFEETIEWLTGAGLIHPAYNIRTAKIPLAGYIDSSKFKIYLLDTGLLGAMLQVSPQNILKPNLLFKEYNGAFIENFAATQLIVNDIKLYYWKSKSDAEIDFVVEMEDKIIPVEVKSGNSGKIKSLRSYYDKFHPELMIRLSPMNLHITNNFMNIPLYRINELTKIIKNYINQKNKIH